MYLRHTTVRGQGKDRTYWRLVRSVRHGSKVQQETVAYLGELDSRGRAKASALAKHFLGERIEQQQSLFEDTQPMAPLPVRIDQVRVERGRNFGDVWLGWLLWQSLRLDEFCGSVMPVGREKIPWPEIASILAIARLCEPSSELHIAEDWYRRTALEDLLGIDLAVIHHTRLYQGLDHLLPHKRALEIHLKNRVGTLFNLDFDVLLYDVTSTYFEGQAEGNHLAARGYSRDHRGDCKQVCIGLVVSREGFPLGYEVFAGNRTDVTTVQEIVQEMESRYGTAKRIWVMDRGMTSADNIEWLQKNGRTYLIGTPKNQMKQWQREIVDREGWTTIRDDVEVKLCPGPDGSETFIICRSGQRQLKEQAMHERFSKRIIDDLTRLGRRLEHAQTSVDRSTVERQIGRILQRNMRAAGKFTVTIAPDDARPSGLKLIWSENRDWTEWAALSEGTYVLRSNVRDWTPDELWKTYIQLTEAEAAFRIHKSDLRIRPIWHQKTERVQAHILVCFLAFVMWKTLQGWQERAGLGSSPRTILEEMARIQSIDVILPLESKQELTLRCVVRPDEAQSTLLARLGLELPRRLRQNHKM